MSERISATDRMVLDKLIAGRTTLQVARELGMTNSAVSMRLLRLRTRFGAETTVQLVAVVLRQGLTS